MKRVPYLHIILFILTFLTTLIAGALQAGVNLLEEPGRILEGFPFAGTLMAILLVHEFSHYLTSKKHKTHATLPYFIPAPSLIGTFGAFIKMRSPISTRKALIDIGASGPIAGFIVSVVACAIGLYYSEVVFIPKTEGAITLGSSILFSFLSQVIVGVPPAQHDILLHPVAFAGWIGLFITSLNLIPVGQLDGGHVAYAFLGMWHKYLSITLIVVLIVLGIFFWYVWIAWAVLMLILRINHPPVLYWETPLERSRRVVGVIALIIFILTFTPIPINISL